MRASCRSQAADVPDAQSAPSPLVTVRRSARAGWYAAKDGAEGFGRGLLGMFTSLGLTIQRALAWLLERLRLAGAYIGHAADGVRDTFAHAAAAVRERLPQGRAAGTPAG